MYIKNSRRFINNCKPGIYYSRSEKNWLYTSLFYRNGEANDPLYGFRIQVTLIDNQACDIESTCLTRNGEFPLDDKSNNETDEKRYGELFSSSKPSCQIQNVCG